jgi:hypothetical protein
LNALIRRDAYRLISGEKSGGPGSKTPMIMQIFFTTAQRYCRALPATAAATAKTEVVAADRRRTAKF